MGERIVIKRVVNIFLMFCFLLLFTFGICYKKGLRLDQMICLFALDLIFFVLFVFLLEHNRALKGISANRGTDYGRVMAGFLLSAILTLGCSFFPEFLKPVILIPLFMTAFSNELVAFAVSMGFTVVLAAVNGFTEYELTEYCVLLLAGCMLAAAMENRKWKIWYSIILFCISTLIPSLFYYLHYQEFEYRIFLTGGIEGAVIILLLLLFYDKLVMLRNTEVNQLLVDMLDDDYPLAMDLKKFSRTEYVHAERVSSLAGRCARVIGADELLCRAAGFYYRIGIMEGDQIAENGERLAEKYCFPEMVLLILREYQGISNPLTSVESAIVQMVDGLVKKLEFFDETTMSSNWNLDMIIYQTLNEFSEQGMYDASGLSMNKFLKIREYLLKEEALI